MASPRFDGPAEKMGIVTSLPASAIHEEDMLRGELDIAKLVSGVEIGTVALLDAEFRLPTDSDQPIRASFINVAEYAAGRTEAKHDSLFGQMLLNGRGLHERPVLTVAKSFNSAEEVDPVSLLAREWAANNQLNSWGDRQQAYLNFGIWVDADGVSHLLSLYEHDVISYDNTFWVDKEEFPEALRPDAVEHAFVDCVFGLGYLHGAGVVHGDAEAKNLAANNSGVRFIDTEGMQPLQHTDHTIEDTPDARKLILRDLDAFLSSTLQVDENRDKIAPLLRRRKTDARLAAIYHTGTLIGQREAETVLPESLIAGDVEFRKLLTRALRPVRARRTR